MKEALHPVTHWHSFEQLREAQEKLLSAALQRAAGSPFYRRRTGADGIWKLEDVPITSKPDLRSTYPFGMLAVPKSELVTYHETSGTGGAPVPTPTFYTAADWAEMVDRFLRNPIPMTGDDTLLVRISYALVMAAHLAHQAGLTAGATVIAADARTLASPYPALVRILRDVEVSLTWSTPFECLVWSAAARVAGHRPDRDFPALRAFYTAGEPLGPARRARISEIWGGVPVLDVYGSTEIGSVSGTCPAGVMHFWADRLLPEIYDPASGTFAREGTGQLVVTTLYQEAMPLIRYDLEDHVELRYEPCECGWKLPTIKVFGRISHDYDVAGRQLSAAQVEEAVFRLPAEYGVIFWRGQAHPDRLVVQIEVGPEHAAAAREELRDLLAREFDVPCEVEPVETGTFVPSDVLTGQRSVLKPRRFFGPDEDWDGAIIHC
ncbi:phenylacetate--CoA ligase family protein [Planobispora takensis]|uniref:Phenylacetate--CoA ligase n=1 Tax=Planobispora takensis TaxID=1367882 RepID=A0A8J3TC25_9ACTN|nr:AMP-binding protein [Planobispora takensis]GII04654.1 phenylacetate--CoA ligase [Planobispora takensis]